MLKNLQARKDYIKSPGILVRRNLSNDIYIFIQAEDVGTNQRNQVPFRTELRFFNPNSVQGNRSWWLAVFGDKRKEALACFDYFKTRKFRDMCFSTQVFGKGHVRVARSYGRILVPEAFDKGWVGFELLKKHCCGCR